MNVKLDLPDHLIEAINAARVRPSMIEGRMIILSRAEMIRRLLAIGLAENLKRNAAKAKTGSRAHKKRPAIARRPSSV